MSALILYCAISINYQYARMIDVMMWSQHFDAFARFVKEN